MSLARRSCAACRRGTPPLSPAHITELFAQIVGWEIENDPQRLIKNYRFANFADAIAAADRIGQAAEQAGHHPRLTVEWGGLTVEWWTHVVSGLHENDFIMAARTDELVDKPTAEDSTSPEFPTRP